MVAFLLRITNLVIGALQIKKNVSLAEASFSLDWMWVWILCEKLSFNCALPLSL